MIRIDTCRDLEMWIEDPQRPWRIVATLSCSVARSRPRHNTVSQRYKGVHYYKARRVSSRCLERSAGGERKSIEYLEQGGSRGEWNTPASIHNKRQVPRLPSCNLESFTFALDFFLFWRRARVQKSTRWSSFPDIDGGNLWSCDQRVETSTTDVAVTTQRY